MGKKAQVNMAPVQELTVEDLMAELERRSIACMMITVNAGPKGEQWHYRVKGSPILTGAMSAVLNSPDALKTLHETPMTRYFNRPT